MSSVKLNLGCGNKKMYSNSDSLWINIDIRPEVKPDVVADIRKLEYGSGSIDEIYLRQTLEHFDYEEVEALLRKFHRWLKKGGKLRIETLNAEEHMRRAISGEEPWEYLLHVLYDYPESKATLPPELRHKIAFNPNFLLKLLKEAGFTAKIWTDETKLTLFTEGLK